MPLSSGQTGWANDTCTAMPCPAKKVLIRPLVRSKNWSGTTTSSGGYSSLRLPTALAEKIRSTPRSLNPKMLARKLSSDGRDPVSGSVPGQECHAVSPERRDT